MKNIITAAAVRQVLPNVTGSWKRTDTQLLQRLDFIFQTNFELRCHQGWGAAFVASFASSVLFLTVIFLLGLSLWGGFFAVLVPFFKGYGYGLSVGFLYGAYGWQGIAYNLLVILPGMFFSSACQNSLHMVTGLFRAPMTADWRTLLQRYSRCMMRLLLLVTASAAVDMLCALCFSWLFHF